MKFRKQIQSRPPYIFLFSSLAILKVTFSFFPASANDNLACDMSAGSPQKVIEVADKIFVRKGVHELMSSANAGGIANISFVIGTKSVAVIDSGGSACDGIRLKALIREITALPVRFIINTHMHPDHVFGNSAFLKENSQFIGHYRLKRALAQRGDHYLKRFNELMGEKILAGTKIVFPDRELRQATEIDLGDRVLVLTPHKTAHTDNDLTVFDKNTKTLWTGDLIFQGHIPVVDGTLKGWLEVLETLKRVDARLAIPGHGPAKISWPEGADPQASYLNKLASDLRKIIADGGTMQEAQSSAGLSEKKNWKLFDEFNARNASAAFAELEWE